MANTRVGIIFEVVNRGTRELANIERSVTTVGRSLRSLATTVVGLAGIGGVTYALARTAQQIDEVAKTSDRLGLATEELTGLQYAAQQLADIEPTAFTSAVELMTRNLSEAARGAGEARYAFAELGLSAAELERLGPANAIGAIADAMARVPNAADRVRLTYTIFGRGQTEMVNLLKEGSAAIAEQQERAARLGLTFSRLDAAGVEAANDALSDMRKILHGVLNTVVIELAPWVEALAGKFLDAATAGEGMGSRTAAALEAPALAAARLLDLLTKVERVTGGLGGTLGEIAYGEKFENEVLRQARDQYEVEMKCQGKRAYKPAEGKLWSWSPVETDRALYEKILAQTWGIYSPAYKPGAVATETDTNVSEIQKFFTDIRSRAETAKVTREQAYLGRQAWDWLGDEGAFPESMPGGSGTAGAAPELNASARVIEQLQRENELLGLGAAQREQAVALEKLRVAAQEDVSKGLRTSVELTTAERQVVEQIVTSRQRQFDTTVTQEVEAIRTETELLTQTAAQREQSLLIQRYTVEAQRQGVELSAAQRVELERTVQLLHDAQRLRELSFGEGFALGIRDMNEELLTTAEIARDLSRQMRDGVVGSLNDAIFRSEKLGESLKRVGLAMLEYWMTESLLKPAATQGMSFGVQIVGGILGALAGTPSAVGTGGSAAGMTVGGGTGSMAFTQLGTRHGGGVIGTDGVAAVAVHHAGRTVGDGSSTRALPRDAVQQIQGRLLSDERLIVARVGEEVLTAEDSRRRREELSEVAVYHDGGRVGGAGPEPLDIAALGAPSASAGENPAWSRMVGLLQTIAGKETRPVVYVVDSPQRVYNALRSREGREIQLETSAKFGG